MLAAAGRGEQGAVAAAQPCARNPLALPRASWSSHRQPHREAGAGRAEMENDLCCWGGTDPRQYNRLWLSGTSL